MQSSQRSASTALEHALRISGHPLEPIVLRKRATDETGSTTTTLQAEQLAAQPEIARDEQGVPLCSSEYVSLLLKPRRNNAGTTNLIVRGLEAIGRKMRPDYQIVAGRDLKPGVNEAVTSLNLARRLAMGLLGGLLPAIRAVRFNVVKAFREQ